MNNFLGVQGLNSLSKMVDMVCRAFVNKPYTLSLCLYITLIKSLVEISQIMPAVLLSLWQKQAVGLFIGYVDFPAA